MLILDDIISFPASGVMRIFRAIYNAALQEQAAEAEGITSELMDLHKMLDSGKITNDLFGAREKALLDRFEELEKKGIRGRIAD